LKAEQGFIELMLPSTQVPLRLILTPYANEFRLKAYLGHEDSEEELRMVLQEKWNSMASAYCDEKGVNMLLTHLFVMKKGGVVPEEPADEKPILHVGGAQMIYTENIPAQVQYTALGHLHRMHRVDSGACPIYYSGSPLSYSFAEANQEKYVILVEAEPGTPVKLREIELTACKKLLRKRAEGIEEALQFLNENQDCLVELTIVTDTFLTAADRKLLSGAHKGIVTIIPEVKNTEGLLSGSNKNIDLSKSMEELFSDYFRQVKGQKPNEDLIALFNEMLGQEEENGLI